jgi:hypothetical protein
MPEPLREGHDGVVQLRVFRHRHQVRLHGTKEQPVAEVGSLNEYRSAA